MGESTNSNSDVDIQYTVNSIHNIDKNRISLPRLNCFDGIQFKLGFTIESNSIAVAAIEKPLQDWSNLLDIDLSLEYTFTVNTATVTYNSLKTNDGINKYMLQNNRRCIIYGLI